MVPREIVRVARFMIYSMIQMTRKGVPVVFVNDMVDIVHTVRTVAKIYLTWTSYFVLPFGASNCMPSTVVGEKVHSMIRNPLPRNP